MIVSVHNFSYGLLTPGLAYVASCLGCFLGLRCATRAQAYQGAARVRWLLLAALSIGMMGIWVMHFIAMLGFTIPGQAILYNVPLTILSMVIAVVVVGIGLLISGFGHGVTRLLIGGLILGLGVASMHYMGVAAMLIPDTIRYDALLVGLSVVIAVLAGTAALVAALRLQSLRSTFAASLVMGVAVSAMHYTGIAAFNVCGVIANPGVSTAGGVAAPALLVPLIFGITVLTFVMIAVISMAPSDKEIREENQLMQRIAGHASAGGSVASR